MQPIFFSNPQGIISGKFREMIDKLDSVRDKTDDYELIKMSKHILAKDYYKDALSWFRLFKDADWYRSDLV